MFNFSGLLKFNKKPKVQAPENRAGKMMACISTQETTNFEDLLKFYKIENDSNLRTNWQKLIGRGAIDTPISESQVSSESFDCCVGLALTGINKNGKRIGILFHDLSAGAACGNNPYLVRRFNHFVSLCDPETVQGVIVGGNNFGGAVYTEYVKSSVESYKDMIKEKTGKDIDYVAVGEFGFTDVLLDVKNNRLFIHKNINPQGGVFQTKFT